LCFLRHGNRKAALLCNWIATQRLHTYFAV
jgi:hypothetical protein